MIDKWDKSSQLSALRERTEGERLTGPKSDPIGNPSPSLTSVLIPEVLSPRL